MDIPNDRAVFESELATFWFDDDGNLCALSKPTERNIELQKKTYEMIRKMTNNTKVNLLSFTDEGTPQDKATRDYAAREMGSIFKAMAVVSNSAAGQFTTDVFLALKGEPIPMKKFTRVEDAREWLKQF
jgi:hypothetical protein